MPRFKKVSHLMLSNPSFPARALWHQGEPILLHRGQEHRQRELVEFMTFSFTVGWNTGMFLGSSIGRPSAINAPRTERSSRIRRETRWTRTGLIRKPIEGRTKVSKLSIAAFSFIAGALIHRFRAASACAVNPARPGDFGFPGRTDKSVAESLETRGQLE